MFTPEEQAALAAHAAALNLSANEYIRQTVADRAR
jgi:predicted HicB family RNase H-like nuclease